MKTAIILIALIAAIPAHAELVPCVDIDNKHYRMGITDTAIKLCRGFKCKKHKNLVGMRIEGRDKVVYSADGIETRIQDMGNGLLMIGFRANDPDQLDPELVQCSVRG